MQTLCIIDQTGENDHAQDQEEDEQRQFFTAGLEGVNEDLEAWRVSSQFEQPQDSNDWEKFQNISVFHVFEKVLEK